jgi:SAM-dependent methyltransferase
MPGNEELSPEAFDEVYAQISAAPQANALFDQVLGPFPGGVEPFSLVPRQGLDRVLGELRLGREAHLVDVCCGRGGIGLWFASVSGARLTGIDFSPAAIAQAQRRVELFVPRPQASFIVADAADTALPASSADAVVCIDALQLVPDASGLLREAARVVRPGGRVVITTWEQRPGAPADLPSSFSIADAAALAGAAGLQIVVCEDRGDWLDQQRAFYQQVIAADSDTGEPALHLLADEGQAMLPYLSFARRLLLVASA